MSRFSDGSAFSFAFQKNGSPAMADAGTVKVRLSPIYGKLRGRTKKFQKILEKTLTNPRRGGIIRKSKGSTLQTNAEVAELADAHV